MSRGRRCCHGAEHRRLGPFPVLGVRERRRSLSAALAERPPGTGAIRVFAYGSLLWRPAFLAVSETVAAVDGHCRRFSVWTVHARGTPERPGLGLELEPGPGKCLGRVLEVDSKTARRDLAGLWEREMHTAVYRPTWLRARAGGTERWALAFVPDPASPQYAGALPMAQQARLIATARGRFGACADYLAETVRALRTAGCPDAGLERLLALVRSSPPRRSATLHSIGR